MSGLLEVIEKRRAYRGISEEPIAAEALKRIMTAATFAPSCFNKQPWRFVVAESEAARQKVRDNLVEGNYWAKKAPAYVLVATKPDLDCELKDRREYALFDAGQGTMSLQYQAVHEGLIAHPIAGFKAKGLKEVFEIPDSYILITVIVLGYPGDASDLNEDHRQSEQSPRSRKAEEEVISYNSWDFGADS